LLALRQQPAIICPYVCSRLGAKKTTMYTEANSTMQSRWWIVTAAVSLLAATCQPGSAAADIGPDLQIVGREAISGQSESKEHVLVFQDGFSMSIGVHRISSDKAVVWLKSARVAGGDVSESGYQVTAYILDNVTIKKSRRAPTVDIVQRIVEQGRSMVISFSVPGRVFITADKKETADVNNLAIYRQARAAVLAVETPQRPAIKTPSIEPKPGKPAETQPAKPVQTETGFRYPINLAPAGDAPVKIRRSTEPDGTYVVTVIGRLLLWQQQPDGALLEFQADNAVIWYCEEAAEQNDTSRRAGEAESFADFLDSGALKAVYVSGDVVMTEGLRTIRADQLYYDFDNKKGLAVSTELKTFDVERGIPVYIRAKQLRLVAENEFAAQDVIVTTSEFHKPQISLTVSEITIIDTTPADQIQGKASDAAYDAQMRDARLNVGDTTVFYWPFLRSNLERPDVPIKSVHAGYDGDFGASIETQWYLHRLLGLPEPDGTESTLALDYYSERGVGAGAEVKYEQVDYFGRLLGYVINDRGEDDLGRIDTRKNLEPPRELRGRFRWQHRQFLPYNWQLTTEVSYLSDKNFLESFYRSEFLADKEQETLVQLKRIEDNWGLSILGKARINDFVDQLEELPSVEYHLAGESLLDDKLTFYSDSRLSRFRQRMDSDSSPVSEDFFSFMSERAELDLPMAIGRTKFVPFVAGTVAYEDGDGFSTDLDGTAGEAEDQVWFAEAGGRLSTRFWKIYPHVKSELWDLDQIRHIITPHLLAVGYTENESTVEQRDTLQIGVSQRLQTKRGPADSRRTVDWMRLDLDITWVNDSADTPAGPSRLLWNKPFIPLVDTFDASFPPNDRRAGSIFGPTRNYFGADYAWRLSDTTAVLSDMYFDMQSGTVEQFNVGFSQFRWPDLSYYIGSRYLRRIEPLDERGSNAFTFAATYKLDPRYTLVFSQQYDFDYGATVQSDITLIRQYHRIYWGLTYSADQSLERQAVVFSIWPQGVPEVAIGPRKYMRLAGSAGY